MNEKLAEDFNRIASGIRVELVNFNTGWIYFRTPGNGRAYFMDKTEVRELFAGTLRDTTFSRSMQAIREGKVRDEEGNMVRDTPARSPYQQPRQLQWTVDTWGA